MARKKSVEETRRPGGGPKSGGMGADLSADPNQPRALPWARSVHGAALVARVPKPGAAAGAPVLRVPDLFDVITYFRARGDSYALIASIGFSSKENPGKALTARALKIWYEAELKRRTTSARPSDPRKARA